MDKISVKGKDVDIPEMEEISTGMDRSNPESQTQLQEVGIVHIELCTVCFEQTKIKLFSNEMASFFV